jgi:hypothetical protein
MTKFCPHCQQPLPIERHGVRMSALKARILDIVSRAGDAGILSESLIERLHHPMSVNTLKAHVSQINDLIEPAGVMIRSYQHRKYLQQAEKRACI